RHCADRARRTKAASSVGGVLSIRARASSGLPCVRSVFTCCISLFVGAVNAIGAACRGTGALPRDGEEFAPRTCVARSGALPPPRLPISLRIALDRLFFPISNPFGKGSLKPSRPRHGSSAVSHRRNRGPSGDSHFSRAFILDDCARAVQYRNSSR